MTTKTKAIIGLALLMIGLPIADNLRRQYICHNFMLGYSPNAGKALGFVWGEDTSDGRIHQYCEYIR